MTTTSGARPVRAARGGELSCLGWQQEAALRMLQNNLDPEVAEHPDELVVYGGTGKAARNWACYDAIVATLRTLRPDETMLVQSGKPVGVFTTHEWAPRVLLANSNLVGDWATWEEFRRLEALGLRVALVTDRPVSPLADEADDVLAAPVSTELTFDSLVGPLALTMGLLQVLVDVQPADAQRRLDEFDQQAADRGTFLS